MFLIVTLIKDILHFCLSVEWTTFNSWNPGSGLTYEARGDDGSTEVQTYMARCISRWHLVSVRHLTKGVFTFTRIDFEIVIETTQTDTVLNMSKHSRFNKSSTNFTLHHFNHVSVMLHQRYISVILVQQPLRVYFRDGHLYYDQG